MIYLHKILPLIFSPLFLVIIIIIFGLIINSKRTILIGILILIFCSLPIFSYTLIDYLESDYKLKKPIESESADAIVVLSGMLKTIKSDEGLSYEWNEASDRIYAGVELFRANKATSLILTGGKLPWSVGIPEGEYLRKVAINLGIPEKNILLTENVENTDQEAKAINKLISKKNPKIILVTSAFHMPRAQTIFNGNSINIIPFPVDFRNEALKLTFMSFIPSVQSLEKTSLFFREMIGRTYYKLRY